jgi:hypothetical protein
MQEGVIYMEKMCVVDKPYSKKTQAKCKNKYNTGNSLFKLI